jgi:hypothetical protein
MSEEFFVFGFLSIGAIALFSFLAVAGWSAARMREREAFYRSETLKKIAESQAPGAAAALEYLREEEEKKNAPANPERLKLGGLVAMAVGVALMVLLRALEQDDPVYLAGLIPLLVGIVLFSYSFSLPPRK